MNNNLCPSFLDNFKNNARKVSKQKGIPRHQALNVIAKKNGYRDWNHLNSTYKNQSRSFEVARNFAFSQASFYYHAFSYIPRVIGSEIVGVDFYGLSLEEDYENYPYENELESAVEDNIPLGEEYLPGPSKEFCSLTRFGYFFDELPKLIELDELDPIDNMAFYGESADHNPTIPYVLKTLRYILSSELSIRMDNLLSATKDLETYLKKNKMPSISNTKVIPPIKQPSFRIHLEPSEGQYYPKFDDYKNLIVEEDKAFKEDLVKDLKQQLPKEDNINEYEVVQYYSRAEIFKITNTSVYTKEDAIDFLKFMFFFLPECFWLDNQRYDLRGVANKHAIKF